LRGVPLTSQARPAREDLQDERTGASIGENWIQPSPDRCLGGFHARADGNPGAEFEGLRAELNFSSQRLSSEISAVRVGVKSKLGLLRWAIGVSVALSVAIHTKLLI
jgi:hypothetical protein